MHTVAPGEWVKIWLSPFAQLLFDVAFAAAFLFVLGLLVRVLRRRRKTPVAS